MWRLLSAATLVALALISGTQAQELTGTLKKIKESKTVTLGYRESSIPFSYVTRNGEPIGYSIDLCLAVVEQIKAELGTDAIAVRYLPVNPQTRIPMVVDGAVDLECGSTTNNAERQKQVAFSPIFFVSGTKLMVKRGSKFRSYRDLKGHAVAVTEGTTNEAALHAVNSKEGLGIDVVPFRDHDQSFAALAAGKVDAWASDDALLYAQAAESANPRGYSVLNDYLSYDPYGVMFRKNDPAFAALVRRTFEQLAESRELSRLYDQWFLHKLPSGRTLGIAISPQLESIFESFGQPTATE